MAEKIQSFTQLIAWQMGHSLVLKVYKLTENFPNSEVFGLSSQMRRCAVSITSNIAEGFGRKSKKEKLNFYNMALGSVTELQNQLIISKDLKYFPLEKFSVVATALIETQKLICGLMRSIRF